MVNACMVVSQLKHTNIKNLDFTQFKIRSHVSVGDSCLSSLREILVTSNG